MKQPHHWPDCERVTCTLNQGPPAEVARGRGWGVGTEVEGDEGYGVTRLLITAIGERSVLAREVDGDGAGVTEGSWTFGCRCWRRVP